MSSPEQQPLTIEDKAVILHQSLAEYIAGNREAAVGLNQAFTGTESYVFKLNERAQRMAGKLGPMVVRSNNLLFEFGNYLEPHIYLLDDPEDPNGSRVKLELDGDGKPNYFVEPDLSAFGIYA